MIFQQLTNDKQRVSTWAQYLFMIKPLKNDYEKDIWKLKGFNGTRVIENQTRPFKLQLIF